MKPSVASDRGPGELTPGQIEFSEIIGRTLAQVWIEAGENGLQGPVMDATAKKPEMAHSQSRDGDPQSEPAVTSPNSG